MWKEKILQVKMLMITINYVYRFRFFFVEGGHRNEIFMAEK